MLPKQRRFRNRCNWMQSDGCHPVCCIFERRVRAFERTIIRISCKCLRHNKSDAVCNFLLWMLNLLECSNTIDNFRQKTTEVVIRKRAKLSRWGCLQRIYIHNVELCRVWHYWKRKRYTHTHTQWFMPRWNEFCWSLPVHWATTMMMEWHVSPLADIK